MTYNVLNSGSYRTPAKGGVASGQIGGRGQREGTACIIDGRFYPSASAASRATGISQVCISKALREGKPKVKGMSISRPSKVDGYKQPEREEAGFESADGKRRPVIEPKEKPLPAKRPVPEPGPKPEAAKEAAAAPRDVPGPKLEPALEKEPRGSKDGIPVWEMVSNPVELKDARTNYQFFFGDAARVALLLLDMQSTFDSLKAGGVDFRFDELLLLAGMPDDLTVNLSAFDFVAWLEEDLMKGSER